MKRKGHILEQIADWDNLVAADREAQAGKVKKNRNIRRHNKHAEADLKLLQRMILELDFPDPEYITMQVKSDCGKWRTIIKQVYFPWRILHHAIMRVIGKDLNESLIYHTFACIKGKGLHFGVGCMKHMLKKDRQGTQWMVKTDYKKFYQSIPHEAIMEALRRKYKDERFLKLIQTAVLTYDSGTEIIDILNDEQTRKERLAHWSIHKPADRQFRSQQNRSLYERKFAPQKLSPLL